MAEEEKKPDDISEEDVPAVRVKKKGTERLSEKLNVGDLNKVFDTTKRAIDLTRDLFTTIDRVLKLFSGDSSDTHTLRDDRDLPSYIHHDYSRDYGRSSSSAPKKNSAPRDPNDLEFDSLGAAEDILARMRAIIGRDGQVSLLQLYDMLRIEAPYTYNDWGWDNLEGVRPRPYGRGYYLNLPPTRRI